MIYDLDSLMQDHPLEEFHSYDDDINNIFSPAKNCADDCLDILSHHYTMKNTKGSSSEAAFVSSSHRSVSFKDAIEDTSSSKHIVGNLVKIVKISMSEKTKDVLSSEVDNDDDYDDKIDYDWFLNALQNEELLHDLRTKLLRSREGRAVRKVTSFFIDRVRDKYKDEIIIAEECVSNHFTSRGGGSRGDVRSRGRQGMNSPPNDTNNNHHNHNNYHNHNYNNDDTNTNNSHQFILDFFERPRTHSISNETALSVVTFDDETTASADGSNLENNLLLPSQYDNTTKHINLSLWQEYATNILKKEKKEIEMKRKNCDGSLDLVIPLPKTKLDSLFSYEKSGKKNKKKGVSDIMKKHKEDIMNIYSTVDKPHKLPTRPHKWVSNMTLDEERKRREINNFMPYLNPLHDKFCEEVEEKLNDEKKKLHRMVDNRFPEASNSYSAERLVVDKTKRERKLHQYNLDILAGSAKDSSLIRYVPTPDWLKGRDSEGGDEGATWEEECGDEEGNHYDYEQTIMKRNVLSRGVVSISSSGNTQFGSDLLYNRPVTPHTTPPVQCRVPGCGKCFQFAWNLTLHESRDHPEPNFKKKFLPKPRLPPDWKKAMKERNDKSRADSLFRS